MSNIEFEPVEHTDIPRRGKYREQVIKWISRFQKLEKEKGTKALRSQEFTDRNLAMSFYDSFKDHIKKKKLPIEVKIRKNHEGTAWQIFLIHKEGIV